MRTVVSVERGKAGLAYSWLPTWIGMNAALLKALDAEVGKKFVGQPLTEAVLDEMHEYVIDRLCERFPNIEGLRDLLDALKYVQLPGGRSNASSQERQAEPPSGP